MGKFRAEVPGRADDWTPECDRAATGLYYAIEEVANAGHPSQMAGALGRLHAARQRFGRAMLDLDKKRRPAFYGLAAR